MATTAAARAHGRRVSGPVTGRRLLAFLSTALVVIGSVGWRRGEYFSGSVDPVVLAKAVVSFLALALAFGLAQSAARRRLGTGSLWALGVVLGSSVFGAYTAGELVPAGIVAVRVAVVAATVFFLLRATPAVQLLADTVRVCGAVAVVAALSGLSTLSSGRLAGTVPAIDPNELALLAGVVVLAQVWRIVLGEGRWFDHAGAACFLAVVWATGSRTALVMLLLGVLVMAVQIRRPRPGLVAGALVLGAVGMVAVVLTGAIAGFLERNGTGASTLESRYIAWQAAVSWADSPWQRVFGGGLATKIIPVEGQWWDTQPLDSSWASLLVQTGLLGLLAALGWVLWVTRGALRAPRPHRILFLGLLVFLVGRSVLESGLFDATPSFLLFLAVSLLAEGSSRARLRAEAGEPAGAIAARPESSGRSAVRPG